MGLRPLRVRAGVAGRSQLNAHLEIALFALMWMGSAVSFTAGVGLAHRPTHLPT